MNNYFDNTPLVQTISKWKWHIAIITIVAAIFGAIFSGSRFITPLYKSEATIYPTHTESYSDETVTEQMLQVMQSQEIMDSVVAKFDLMKHYKIDKSYKYWKTALVGEYRSNVSISRTPYDAVTIKVYDSDPEIAYEMVNEIFAQYCKMYKRILKAQRKEQADFFHSTLEENEIFIDSLINRLSEIGKDYGVYEVTSQSREVTRAFLNNGKSKKLDTMMQNLGQYGPEVNKINTLLEYAYENYHKTKYDFEREYRYYSNDFSYGNIISAPYASDKKAYPVRWVVVALCGLCACFISILAAYVMEHKNSTEK